MQSSTLSLRSVGTARNPANLAAKETFNCLLRSFTRRASQCQVQHKQVKAAAPSDLTLERTEQRTFSDLPAQQDLTQHPAQLIDDRHLLQSCEQSSAPLKVALLLSGGVDSSTALHLLKQAGHHVTAFYLQIWFQEDFRNYWDQCPWEDDLGYCQQVCQDAEVELHVVPLTAQYWDRVVAHSIAEIKAGRTPNPDILCNSRVKFGAFYEYLDNLGEHKFDRIASGHYARIIRQDDPDDPVQLALAPDAIKDQTYFLAHLTQAQLSRVIFPLGHFTKAEVRAVAQAAGLPNQARRDSQGICFLGKVKFSEFIQQHLGQWPGCIIEAETGEVIGYHQGFWFHTVGQRRGIPLHGGPWYVTQKDIHKNAVYVSRDYYNVDKERNMFTCSNISWIYELPDLSLPVQCKVRHGPVMYSCSIKFTDGKNTALEVNLDCNDQGLAPGQYAVFYQEDVCLGSGVIETTGICSTESSQLPDDLSKVQHARS